MSKKHPPDFEKQLERLQVIVTELENMELPLEQNVALYKEGRQLARSCKTLLEKARNEVMLCDKDEMTQFTITDALAPEE